MSDEIRTWTLNRTDHEHVSVLTDDPGTERDIGIGERVEVIEAAPVAELLRRIQASGPILKVEIAADVATLLAQLDPQEGRDV